MKKREKKIHSPAKQKVLALLLSGTVLGLTRSYHTQRKIIRSIPKVLKDIDRNYLYRILDEFNHDRLIDWQEKSDGSVQAILTEKGKEKAIRFNPDYLKIKKPTNWDKRWRMVIYDIPDQKKAARDALRLKLNELGFKEWQKSVFIHPYPCRDEIDFIIEFFEIRPYVRYAELINPTNEAELRLYFKI